jgi:hypothetical protein
MVDLSIVMLVYQRVCDLKTESMEKHWETQISMENMCVFWWVYFEGIRIGQKLLTTPKLW